MLRDQQAKVRITVLVGIINSDYLEDSELLLHNRGREKDVWNSGGSLGYPLVLLLLAITVEGKATQATRA